MIFLFKKPVFENVTENYKYYYCFLIPVPVFLRDFQSVMDYERIKGRRKSSSIFCCNGYMHSKKTITNLKLTFGVFYPKSLFWYCLHWISKFITKKSNPKKLASVRCRNIINHERKTANNFPPFPNKFEVFDNFLRIPGLGTINGVIFCKTFSSANNEFALKFLPEIDYILSG